MDRCGTSCCFIVSGYLSWISLLNLRSCPWVMLLVTYICSPHRSESQLGADQESTAGPAPGVFRTPFLQVLLELNGSFIHETFKFCFLSKASSPDTEKLISVFTVLMSQNGRIPTHSKVESILKSRNMKKTLLKAFWTRKVFPILPLSSISNQSSRTEKCIFVHRYKHIQAQHKKGTIPNIELTTGLGILH